MAHDRVVGHGWELLGHRLRTPYAEIDLVFRCRKVIHVVEVKSLGPHGWLASRVGRRQKEKLLAARAWAETKGKKPAALDLAVVSHAGEITWIPDFLS